MSGIVGVYKNNKVNFGQIATTKNNSIWLAFDGEIFNYRELKKELLEKKVSLKSNSDAEVILSLYQEYGNDFLQKLNGMFAIALWDDRKKRLILARDQVGFKSLYYFLKSGKIIFGSEIKSILAHSDIQKEIDLESLDHYFSLYRVPLPKTIFKNIFGLNPAEMLILDKNKIIKKKYWEIKFEENKNISEDEAAGQLLNVLKSSLKNRIPYNKSYGFCLSGGVDSGITLALASQLSFKKPIKTLTVNFENDSNPDPFFAKRLAKLFKTDHNEFWVSKKDFLKNFYELAEVFDQPRACNPAIYLLIKKIDRKAKIIFSSEGGDECFGGYGRHILASGISQLGGINLLQEIKKRKINQFTPLEKKFLGYMLINSDILNREFQDSIELKEWQWLPDYYLPGFREEEKEELLSPIFKNLIPKFNLNQFFKEKYIGGLKAKNLLNRVLELDFKKELPENGLRLWEECSAFFQKEIRYPFLDINLIQFAASLPVNMKIREFTKKYILKKIALNFLPKEIFEREKSGLSAPYHYWLNSLQKEVKDILSFPRIKKHNFFNPEFIADFLRKSYSNNGKEMVLNPHLRARNEINMSKIWGLINFQLWWEKYFK